MTADADEAIAFSTQRSSTANVSEVGRRVVDRGDAIDAKVAVAFQFRLGRRSHVGQPASARGHAPSLSAGDGDASGMLNALWTSVVMSSPPYAVPCLVTTSW